MALLVRNGLSFFKNTVRTSIRTISTTPRLLLKEIHEENKEGTLIIEGVTVPSPRTAFLVKPETTVVQGQGDTSKEVCYMCALGLDVKHTDVLILSQFVRSDGCMLPRRITGLCRRQQKYIGKLVTMAQKAGLMINLTPHWCNKDPTKRRDYKKFNTYFDESTVFMKRIPNQKDKFKR